jgi:uncharacterized membrane protein SpoIIM required for sporulation
MVLESIITIESAEKRPWNLMLYGFLFSSVAILLALWVFASQASIIMVFFTVLACAPLVYLTIQSEEHRDIVSENELALLNYHRKTIQFLMFLFIGMTFAFAFWYTMLPQTTVNNLYSIQTQTILSINNRVSGNFIESLTLFSDILFNNFKVLIFCIIFSLIYGFGSIFILTWNASVIGTAMGNLIKVNFAAVGGMLLGANYWKSVSLGFLRYFVHGLPEIAAYFIGGLAGGILSVAVINRDIQSRRFERILFDTSQLVLISLLFLVIAAFIEVYITPAFFR